MISVTVARTVYGEEISRYYKSTDELRSAAEYWRNRTLGGTSQNGLSEADWEEAQQIMAAATILPPEEVR